MGSDNPFGIYKLLLFTIYTRNKEWVIEVTIQQGKHDYKETVKPRFPI